MHKQRVAILLSHYNGSDYLREQLNSILNQNADNFSIDIYVRDDGSNNVNLVNLRQMTSCLPINVFEGSNIGVTKSFFTLLEQVDSYDYYAFCDQDDVWLDDKISSAVTMMKDSEGPVLYCSAYTLVDAKLNLINFENHVNDSFENALFKNFCTGCTCLINNKLRSIILNTDYTKNVPMHDWWMLMVAYLTGTVIFDQQSHILYRQHGGNVVGGRTSFIKKTRRFMFNILSNDETRSKMYQQLLISKELYNSEKVALLELILNSKRNIFLRIKLVMGLGVKYAKKYESILVKFLILIGRF